MKSEQPAKQAAKKGKNGAGMLVGRVGQIEQAAKKAAKERAAEVVESGADKQVREY